MATDVLPSWSDIVAAIAGYIAATGGLVTFWFYILIPESNNFVGRKSWMTR